MRTDDALAWLCKHGPCRAKNIEQREAFERLVRCGHAMAVIQHVPEVRNVRGASALDNVYHLTETGRGIIWTDD